jgi:pimeloyl-ACP methyl ester carboxylesterase
MRATVLAGMTACVVAAAPAHAASLYEGPGPRPGPDILYEPPATAPQLTNAGIWRAPPILVSGTSAYRDGEFLYQDFLYDDHGANGGVRDPADPRTSDDTFSAPNGTYTYPEDPAYAHNAADLVELRVRPLADATAFRVTLNSLTDPELVAFTIALGDSPEPLPLPHGANASAPAELFLTVHGTTAELANAAGGEAIAAPAVSVDRERRQIEVRVPRADWDPGESRVPMSAGVGLWDREARRYLLPGFSATEDRPGGAGRLSAPSAFFNAAFRFAEPFPRVSDFGHNTNPAWWRDLAQGHALADGHLGRFRAVVDFGKLAAGVDDDMTDRAQGVPSSGPMNRILASRFEPHQGLDPEAGCGSADACTGILGGRLQPYAIYVPHGPAPAEGWGLTLLLHSLAAGYNQFAGSQNQRQFGEAGAGSIVITPAGRGPDGWYTELAEADTFEVWADVASRYALDAGRAVIAGYSMGGYGTFKLATRYPDLFARAQPTVGPPALGAWLPPVPPTGGDGANTFHMLPSLRNVPVMSWVGILDELVPYPGSLMQGSELDRLGYRYQLDSFAGEHLTLAFNDEYGPAADFLADARIERDPPHVTYVLNPEMDFPEVGVATDHAYWLSGLALRDRDGDAPRGTIDARSAGFGVGDPVPLPTERGGGVLTGGAFLIPFMSQSREWSEAPAAPAANRLEIRVENLRSVTIHPERARVGCDAELDVTTDGPVAVTLAGCGRTDTFLR